MNIPSAVTPQNSLDTTGEELDKFIEDIKSILTDNNGLNEYEKKFDFNKICVCSISVLTCMRHWCA